MDSEIPGLRQENSQERSQELPAEAREGSLRTGVASGRQEVLLETLSLALWRGSGTEARRVVSAVLATRCLAHSLRTFAKSYFYFDYKYKCQFP